MSPHVGSSLVSFLFTKRHLIATPYLCSFNTIHPPPDYQSIDGKGDIRLPDIIGFERSALKGGMTHVQNIVGGLEKKYVTWNAVYDDKLFNCWIIFYNAMFDWQIYSFLQSKIVCTLLMQWIGNPLFWGHIRDHFIWSWIHSQIIVESTPN